jgi:tetratricopeptide (TPR) repeat protein
LAIDRNKVTAAAQKYIQKGAYKKAIKEYKKIIASKPDDVRILLKIGDIQARDGQSETAARTYTEVADHYVAHGFFLKAVAAYKLLLGADAENVEARLRLADLYFQLGLLRDALTNYQAVAAVFSERGWVDRYLQTLQKVADIDPDHAGNRIKFAEELARFDQEVGAAEQFMIAAAALRREGRFEDFTKVMERYVHLSPDDVVAVHEACVGAHSGSVQGGPS